MEKIIKIEEFENLKLKEYDNNKYDGYKIKTSKQLIYFGINNGQSCCESWGYLTTNDNVDDFVGSKIISIKIIDPDFKTKDLPFTSESLDYGSCIFINIETTNGTLQIVAYNEHNGYYGHTVLFISQQLNINEKI